MRVMIVVVLGLLYESVKFVMIDRRSGRHAKAVPVFEEKKYAQ